MKNVKLNLLNCDIHIQEMKEMNDEKLGSTMWKYDGIYIYINNNTSYNTQLKTLLHELLHIGDEELGINLEHNQIIGLSYFLYEILKNKKLKNMIIKEEKNERNNY